jgi:hypothetical protein
VHVPVLLVIVIVTVPVPPPVQTPLVVTDTGKPELAVAATLNVAPLVADAGAEVVTEIVWLAFNELTVSLIWGAALKLALPT